ncbi:potassium channel protein [Cryptococcus deuterogattii 99/473]|uniref:Potassium channel protein n=1 Tax=Cryptococcus deuterogattii Ram5 TaxID=1296110 RepID=A0A0D0UYC2_9TREE|nr:potassium channel protein [Cryptococcus deuterogattii Ram5]KIY57588.1 potassium channel protein [Cryptococcus deuterogattii 99/473]
MGTQSPQSVSSTATTKPSRRQHIPVTQRKEKQQDQAVKKENCHVKDLSSRSCRVFKKKNLRTFAKYCPLISAILAPFSTLMDIPALSQRWYSQNGVTQPDPKASLALSGVGLGLNVIANILLVMRFSSKAPFWVNHSTKWSLYCWLGKTVVAAVNLIVFGILTRNDASYQYLEGFWCAIVSFIGSTIISFTLLFHYFLAFGHSKSDNWDVRSQGRRFMLSVTAFIAILGVQSLVFSRIEHWEYVGGIYMSVQTALTIGYGDYVPTTTAGKVLIFPFSVLTISQLGNEIALIISFISQRAEERRKKWRLRFERAIHRQANSMRPKAGLMEEMALVYKINSREELMTQLYDLVWSAISLIVFWVLGAAAFSQIEGWSYGNAMYMVMVLSLTIGFGDYAPVQPAGKVVFIVYALMAVPIVTSFAVQTITGLLSTFSQHNVNRETFIIEQQRSPEAFAPHVDYIDRYHKSYADLRDKLLQGNIASEGRDARGENEDDASEGEDNEAGAGAGGETESEAEAANERDASSESKRDLQEEGSTQVDVHSTEESGIDEVIDQFREMEKEDLKEDARREEDEQSSHPAVVESESGDRFIISKEERQLEVDLLKQLLAKTVSFEVEARQMLLDSMQKGVERTILLADRNVQIRDVKAIRGDDASIVSVWAGEEQAQRDATDKDKTNKSSSGPGADPDKEHHSKKSQSDMLTKVTNYRTLFAEILVLGGILQKLEGAELKQFERWRGSLLKAENGRDGGGGRGEDGEANDEMEVANRLAEGDAEDIKVLGKERWPGLMKDLIKRQVKKMRHKDGWDKEDMV